MRRFLDTAGGFSGAYRFGHGSPRWASGLLVLSVFLISSSWADRTLWAQQGEIPPESPRLEFDLERTLVSSPLLAGSIGAFWEHYNRTAGYRIQTEVQLRTLFSFGVDITRAVDRNPGQNFLETLSNSHVALHVPLPWFSIDSGVGWTGLWETRRFQSGPQTLFSLQTWPRPILSLFATFESALLGERLSEMGEVGLSIQQDRLSARVAYRWMDLDRHVVQGTSVGVGFSF